MGETSDIPWFRELFDLILDYRRWHLYDEVLLPWSDKARTAMDDASRFRHLHDRPQDDDQWMNTMWNLYALSRVSDELLLPFQATPAHHCERPAMDVEQYVAFFQQAGLVAFDAVPGRAFSPFHHEVFAVEAAEDEAEPITVSKCLWPGLWLGQMLFARAGVEVRGGSRFIRKEVAEASTLYFAYRRLTRHTNDLSMGWGSNSQWRTSIRRDYQSVYLYYNMDGRNPLWLGQKEPDRDGLTPEERLELCKNRCFLHTTKPHDDLWPFDDRWQEVSMITDSWRKAW